MIFFDTFPGYSNVKPELQTTALSSELCVIVLLLGTLPPVAYVVVFLENPLVLNFKLQWKVLMEFVLCVIAY